jgi:hypothetical protein
MILERKITCRLYRKQLKMSTFWRAGITSPPLVISQALRKTSFACHSMKATFRSFFSDILNILVVLHEKLPSLSNFLPIFLGVSKRAIL